MMIQLYLIFYINNDDSAKKSSCVEIIYINATIVVRLHYFSVSAVLQIWFNWCYCSVIWSSIWVSRHNFSARKLNEKHLVLDESPNFFFLNLIFTQIIHGTQWVIRQGVEIFILIHLLEMSNKEMSYLV